MLPCSLQIGGQKMREKSEKDKEKRSEDHQGDGVDRPLAAATSSNEDGTNPDANKKCGKPNGLWQS